MAMATREAYGEELAQLVLKNPRIVVLDADLAGSTKTSLAKRVCPQRFFDMGIAEADMIGHAAGFAASGYIPFCSSFAIFASGRAWEQIRNSVAYPHLNVKICATHAGITVGEDGVSHQAIEDIALMRSIPGMEVYVPCDAAETRAVIDYISTTDVPTYVRLGRYSVDDVYDKDTKFDFSRIHVVRKGTDAVMFACGVMVQEALKAAMMLEEENISLEVIDICRIKKADEKGIASVLKQFETVFTAEEHNIIGGLGDLIAEVSITRCPRRITRIGIEDRFAESGDAAALMAKYNLNAEGICRKVLDTVQK